ncbi:MAG: lipoate--protein ligase family protein [Candidatus Aminicenantales bacterium]
MTRTWHLFLDRLPLKGSWNMAVDEFLLSRLTDRPSTSLRFYQWERPTASLGCSQDAAQAVDADFCRRRGVDIVRRITGGKLVLHDREVTYALVSSDDSFFSMTVTESYRRISQALSLGLQKMGLRPELAGTPPAEYSRGTLPCFSLPGRDELQAEGRKIVGSAQKRTGKMFLQHGSIPLEHDEALLRSITRLPAEGERMRMTSLSELLGSQVSFDWAVERLQEGFAEFFGAAFERLAFTPEERDAIRRLQRQKYEDAGWTFHRLLAPAS